MTWWGWMVIGAVLLGAELILIDAQFYLLFIGVSAFLVGLAGLLGIAVPEWVQWLSFAGLCLFFFFTFRRTLYQKLRAGGAGFPESPAGSMVTIDEALEPGQDGKTLFRGSKWNVRNVGDVPIAAASRAKIVEVDGVMLHVVDESQ